MKAQQSGRRWMDAGEGRDRVVLGAAALPATVPGRVLIAPWGRVVSSNGTFVIDAEAASAVLEAFSRHGTDVPVDYEHQSLGGAYSSPSGQAPAAGWIRSPFVITPAEGDAGLYAEVEWTEAGRARLAAREYRYLSPVVLVRRSDRRVQALHSVALTNKPAIAGLTPIVNQTAISSEDGSSQTENTELPPRGETLAAGDVSSRALDAVDPRRQETSGELEMLRMRLGMSEGSESSAVLGAARRELDALDEAIRLRDARERVERAFRAGKLTGTQQEWAMGLACAEPERFEQWLATAPVVVCMGRSSPPEEMQAGARHRSTVEAAARAAFRAEPLLALLTSEEAWIAEALHEAGVMVEP